jgi:hypothetical protein
MKWFNSQPIPQHTEPNSAALLGQFISLKSRVASLPPLSPVDKVKFDQDVDLDHLYYSSKIEGTTLSEFDLKRAVYEEAA